MATQAEAAAFLGVSRRTFIEYVNKGIISKAPNGEYNLHDVFIQHCDHLMLEAVRKGVRQDLLLAGRLEAARDRERFLRTATAAEIDEYRQERAEMGREFYRRFKKRASH